VESFECACHRLDFATIADGGSHSAVLQQMRPLRLLMFERAPPLA
jgi:hypothetical protein